MEAPSGSMSPRDVVLGHDLVAWVARGLAALPGVDPNQRDALVEMFRRADLVILRFGLEPPCSLAEREKGTAND